MQYVMLKDQAECRRMENRERGVVGPVNLFHFNGRNRFAGLELHSFRRLPVAFGYNPGKIDPFQNRRSHQRGNNRHQHQHREQGRGDHADLQADIK